MHQFAEYGMVAHWRYKEAGAKGGQVGASSDYDRQLSWMRQLLAWNSDVESQSEPQGQREKPPHVLRVRRPWRQAVKNEFMCLRRRRA